VPAAGSPTVWRRRLSAELRRLRGNERGGEVARAIGWSPTKISRAESGRDGIPADEVAKLLGHYGVTGPHHEQLLGLAKEAAQRGWWEDYADILSPDYMEFIGLEAGAVSVAQWHSDAMPGLLQTEAYARQLSQTYQRVVPTTSDRTVDRVVEVRIKRQERLHTEPALQLSAVIDEAVLLRKIGDRQLMHHQLRHLAETAERPNVDLRVLPLNQDSALVMAPFTIISFGPSTISGIASIGDVVSFETLTNELLDDETDTQLHRVFFREFTQSALSPEDSRRLIQSTAESVWS